MATLEKHKKTRENPSRVLALLAYLEEPAQPPHLEEGLPNDDANDEGVPPLDSAVGALGRVAVGPLAEDDVRLLVLDLVEQVGETAD